MTTPNVPALPFGSVPFDPACVDAATLERLNKCRDHILQSQRTVTAHALHIGKALRIAKQALPHGMFEPWCEGECGWSLRTAQRYMNAHKAFEAESDTVSVLPLTAVHALSAPSTPEPVRVQVIERLKAGERPTADEIAREITSAAEERRRQREEDKLSVTQRKRRERNQKRRQEQEEIERLEHEKRIVVRDASTQLVIAGIMAMCAELNNTAVLEHAHNADWFAVGRRLVENNKERTGGAK